MGADLRTALEDCLARRRAGEPLESVLRRYPGHAEELRELLRVVATLRRLSVRPRPEAVLHGRQLYFQAAVAGAPRRPLPSSAGWGLFPKLAAAVFALVLVVGLAGGGTVYAAINSEPDSALYPVKLWVEDARLWFAFNDDDRAALLLDYTESRHEEIEGLLGRGRPVRGNVLEALEENARAALSLLAREDANPTLLARAARVAQQAEELLVLAGEQLSPNARDNYLPALSAVHAARLLERDPAAALAFAEGPHDFVAVTRIVGAVQVTAEGAWTVGGVPLASGETAYVEGELPESGAFGTVVAVRDRSGTLHALTVSVDSSAAPSERLEISGLVDSYDRGLLIVNRQVIRLQSQSLVLGRLQAGVPVEVTALRQPDGSLVAQVVRVRPTPAGEQSFVYEGVLEAVEESADGVVWQVGGQRFQVDELTLIDARVASLREGVWARVEAVRRGDLLAARRLRVLAASGLAQQVRLEGRIEEIGDSGVIISGIRVRFAALLLSDLAQKVGSRIIVEGVWDGEAILVETPPSESAERTLFTVEGVLTAVEQGRWEVSGVPFEGNDETEVEGEPLVGARVVVYLSSDPEGETTVLQLEVVAPPPLPVEGEPPAAPGSEEGPASDTGTPSGDTPTGETDGTTGGEGAGGSQPVEPSPTPTPPSGQGEAP